MDTSNDTIAAIATPLGRGGVGIVRLSGSGASSIVAPLFQASSEAFTRFGPYRLHHGWIRDQEGRALDEVLVSYMPGPGSYTGEDVMEINCHGGPAILEAVLEAVLNGGARMAGPGEFTRRAFLNDRLDLTQAEAVAEMINASTRAGLDLAVSKLAGGLGRLVQQVRHELEALRLQLTVAIDFPEEELECLSLRDLQSAIQGAADNLRRLLHNFERDRLWRDGALVVLAGPVNAGKSSLMNALLGRERAIVTPVPGTTRDYLEEAIDLSGMPVRLVDTAGLREAEDEVEEQGLLRGRALMRDAELILLVCDGSVGVAADDVRLALELGPSKTLAVINKRDLRQSAPPAERSFSDKGFEAASVSARTGQGLDELISLIRRRLMGKRSEPDPGELVPNLRQRRLIRQALEELEALSGDAGAQVPYDLLGVRLEMACSLLAEVTGDITPEDVLDRIFSSFCIGK